MTDAVFYLNIILKENETIDDLQYNGLRIIQKKDGFRFGLDACCLQILRMSKTTQLLILVRVRDNTHTDCGKPGRSL